MALSSSGVCKKKLIEADIDEHLIFPPLNSRKPELKLAGMK